MKITLLVAALSALCGMFAGVAGATSHSTSPAASYEQHNPLTDGEVRKVDKETKKLTIRHGPIQNLDMPAMTMVFQVSDPAVLDKLKPGDKIRFVAEKQGGSYFATRLQPAP